MFNLLKNLVSPHHILVKSCDNIIYDVISDINYDHTTNSVTNSLVQFVFYSLVICVLVWVVWMTQVDFVKINV